MNFTRETGVGPFDADDSPGNDSGTSNSIIRTNDIISYKYEVLVQGGDATNVVLRLTTAPGLELTKSAFCRDSNVTPVSSISGDVLSGYSLVCNVGDIGEGSQVLYSLTAKVSGALPNGSTVSMLTASVESDQTPQESFPGTTETVSAAPKLDLMKQSHARLIGRRDGPSGEPGIVYVFPITVSAEGDAKGNELVTAPISFTDDLSGVSPNARLYQGWAGAAPDACIPNFSDTTYYLWGQIPRAYTQTSDGGPGGPGAGPAERSAWDSGDIDCTVPSSGGGTTTITITGADLSGNHRPTLNAGGGALDASRTHLVAGNLIVWIPIQDITDAGGELPIDNTYSDLNAVSISGQANTDPNMANNTRAFLAKNGSGSRYFYNHTDYNSFGYLPGQVGRRTGDGYVIPGQVLATRHYQYNQNWLTQTPFTNMGFCTSFDNSTQIIKETTGGHAARMDYGGTFLGGPDAYTIEYGTGDFGATAGCDDADSPDGWHSSIYNVPGGPAAITKVRALSPQMSPPTGNSTYTITSLVVRYEALDNPVGTIIAQWGTFKYDQLNNGDWYAGTPYDETTAGGSYGDRVFLTKVAVRVDKDTDPSGTDQVLAGDQISFKLQPSATTPVNTQGQQTNVTVRDTLPSSFEYILGSASPSPNSTISNADGTTTLVWEFPGTVINDPMSEITYDVLVNPTTPNLSNAINKVVISSPNDGSPEESRSEEYGILVLNPSGFSVYKAALSQLIEPDGGFGYTLNYANTGTSDYASVVLIDVLPDPSITHNPPTDYDGTSAFVSVSGTSGETFEYTKAIPSTIAEDPNAASNQPGGSTVWCSGFTGGSCPSNPSEVTAFRATSPAFLEGQPTRTITLNMNSSGNDSFDVYSNRFVARAAGLAFAVTSPVASVRVRTADLNLTKTVEGPNSQPANLVDFTLTLQNEGPHGAIDTVVRDILPSGYSYISDTGDGAYDPATGLWTIPSLPDGASTSLTIHAKVLPVGNYLNTAEIISQAYADPDSKPDNMASAPGEDDTDSASILAYLTGNIFIDNGVGGGTAHDGLLNGTEFPSNVATLVFTEKSTGTQIQTTTVNPDGTWFAILPDGFTGEVVLTAVPEPGYRIMSEGPSTLPGVINPDTTDGMFEFAPVRGSIYSDINIGLIEEPTLTQDQTSTVQPGQVVELAHQYIATTSGTVTFSIQNEIQNPAGGFTSTIFQDTNCDGTADQPISADMPVIVGQTICLTVRTQAGAGISPTAQSTYDLQAVTTYAGTVATHTITNTDTIGSDGTEGGDLLLTKLVRNVTTNSPEGRSNTGDIGDTLEYRIIMDNPSTAPLTNVTVSDMTPAYTVLAAPVQTPIVFSGVTCTLQVPATGNTAGYAGPLEWLCPGEYPAGMTGSMTFQVVISP